MYPHNPLNRNCRYRLTAKILPLWFTLSLGFNIPLSRHKFPQRRNTRLFGIKGFRTWLQSQFPTAITSIEHSHFYSSRAKLSYFNHVLIDVHHILHVVIRRSNDHTHALQLLTQELDKCTTLATPTSCLVLALDGLPCAAKLVTQRQRRRAIMKRSLWLKTKLPQLLHVIQRSSPSAYSESSRLKAWKRRLLKDERALCITHGHAFMQQVGETCTEWARAYSTRTGITHHVSTSQEPGEGEIKLLYWLIHQGSKSHTSIPTQASTVAFVGGDSDLILLGLATPNSIYKTRKIFFLLPTESNKTCILSLHRLLESLEVILSPIRLQSYDDWYHVRLDMILLFIMNGNDYLPKLRGSPGLHSMFQIYIQLIQSCYTNLNESIDDERMKIKPFFFTNPENQSMNIPFCQTYFTQLAQSSTVIVESDGEDEKEDPMDPNMNLNRMTPLSALQNLVNIGILPSPISFSVISSNEETKLLKLKLGDSEKTFQVELKKDASRKTLKQSLAKLALENLFGNHTMDIDTIFALGDNWMQLEEEYTWKEEFSHHLEHMGETRNLSSDTDKYVRGLRWNMKMYQEGFCSDYEYDYGRRLAPTVHDFMSYFNNR